MTPLEIGLVVAAASLAALGWAIRRWWLAAESWETAEHLNHPNDGDGL